MTTAFLFAAALAQAAPAAADPDTELLDRPAGTPAREFVDRLAAADGTGDWQAFRHEDGQGDFGFALEVRRSPAGDVIVYFIPAAEDSSQAGKVCRMRAGTGPSPAGIRAAGLQCIAGIRGPVTVVVKPVEPPRP
jgi:hypothetical protein